MKSTVSGITIAMVLALAGAVGAGPQELLQNVGIPPADGQRGQMDTVGFVTTAAQMDSVLAQARALAAPRRAELAAAGWDTSAALRAAVCPHDDYYYASRLYSLVLPQVKAKTVLLCGVFHKARVFDCRDRLVFDSFDSWRGPYGPLPVSDLRAELLARLPREDVYIDDDMHQVEHSLEAITPWLQALDPGVEIVPILVPYMDWETGDRLAGELSDALVEVMRERGWSLGRDVAIVVSADAIHYGDAGWGGSSYADLGTDPAGYARAVERDRALAETTLCGPIEKQKLREFLYTCVEPEDVTRYKLTWCGRFSIPFGLGVAMRVGEALDGSAPAGTLLGYGTSLGEISVDLEAVPGLGTTAPNHLHHWVGYPAIGYR